MADGHIAERGNFEEIMANRGEFSRTFDDFVTKDQKGSEAGKAVDLGEDFDGNAEKRRAEGREVALMQSEERNIGTVNLQAYKRYFQSRIGVVLLPAIFVTIVLIQATDVLSYW